MSREAWLALLLDGLFGDPPGAWHPVAWMGRYIAAWQHARPRDAGLQKAWGLATVLSGVALVVLGMRRVERWLVRWPRLWAILARAWLLKCTLAVRGLARAASEVQHALARDDLPAARQALAWHLVSRPTQNLTPSQIAAAAIESVFENASDGSIAPLFFYRWGGLPAAWAYRFVNTADAMLGYLDERRHVGWAAARLDDVLNGIPARLTAGLVVLAAGLMGGRARDAWRVWRRDAHRTASPNAGHPMAAAAGALGVVLDKPGHYRLNPGARPPTARDIGRAVRLLYATVVLAWLVLTWRPRT